MKLFIKGKPQIVTVDDFVPTYSGTRMMFAERGFTNQNLWASIMEKAFAKINSNYENLQLGMQAESFRVLTGAPTRLTNLGDSISIDDMWNVIEDSLNKGYHVGCDTGSAPSLGLTASHAHSVLGTYYLKDKNGNVKHRLL